MQEIKIEQVNPTECKINIEIPADIVDKKFDDFFKNIKNQAQIPGFRKGKAPVSVLKQHFGLKARAPVVNILLGEYYEKAIRDGNISPVGSPNIKDFDSKTSDYPGSFGFDNSYSVEMTIEVLPKIDPVGYTGMELKIDNVDEVDMFDAKMNEYREQFAERTQISDRGAALGDSVVIDFTGYIDNAAFDGGAAKAAVLNKLGSANYIPGFEDQLVGMKSEENKKIAVKFPDNYHAKHLSGKEATFDVTMHSIIEVKPSEINEDLALMAGFNSLENMIVGIKQDVENQKRAIIRRQMEGQIAQKLLEVNNFIAPASLVKSETENLMKRFEKQQAELPPNFIDQVKKSAEFNVKKALMLDSIYEKEKDIEVTPDELNNALDEHARINNKTKDELISLLYNSNQMDSFVGVLRTAKVIDFIINNAKK